MATWIVHLRLAENLLEWIDGLDQACFALGSIAPDSGIPDEKRENFDPPPEVTHFRKDPERTHPYADLEFYRRYLEPLNPRKEDPKRYAFLLGYFFHLITDNLWSTEIGGPAQERFAAE